MILLSTGSLFEYGIARVFELAAGAGFDGVELLVDHRWDTRQPDYLHRLSQATGLPVPIVHAPFVPYLPGWPRDGVGRLQASTQLARALGARVIVVHLPHRLRAARIDLPGVRASRRWLPLPVPGERAYRRLFAAGVHHLEGAQGVQIAVETMPAQRILGWRVSPYAFNTLAAWDTFPHLTLDTTHLGTWGLDPLATYQRLRDRVVHIHLSNFDGRQHRLPDRGRLSLHLLLQRLARDGYPGAVSLEVNPDALGAEDGAQVQVALGRACAFIRTHLQR
jgi:sugar phosphate isomerase/epimerase